MKIKEIGSSAVGRIFSASATFVEGFLSFTGAFLLIPSVYFAGAAFFLAVAYEDQINKASVAGAFRRMFDKNYLKRGIARNHLQNLTRVLKEEQRYFFRINEAQTPQQILARPEIGWRPTYVLAGHTLYFVNKTTGQCIQKKIFTDQERDTFNTKVTAGGLGESTILSFFDLAYVETTAHVQLNDAAQARRKLAIQLEENTFLSDYNNTKYYIEDLEEYLEKLEQYFGFARYYSPKKRKEYKEQKEKVDQLLFQARRSLLMMEMFFLQRLTTAGEKNEKYKAGEELTTSVDQAVDSLIEDPYVKSVLNTNRESLLTEIETKQARIKITWLFAIACGVAYGFAGLIWIQDSIATAVTVAAFSGLSATPFGFIVTLSVLAAVGYTFLIYQSISDMIQEGMLKRWLSYFKKRENESLAKYAIKCGFLVIAAALAVFATVTTAGTWWWPVKNGVLAFGAPNAFGLAVQSISIGLMTLPDVAFNIDNSIESIDKISRSDYTKLITNVIDDVSDAFKKENIICFLNPFRFIEKLISFTAKTILFCGHLVSEGLQSDDTGPLQIAADVAGPINTVSGGITEFNYLPDEKRTQEHTSPLLLLLFVPVILLVTALKILAAGWDFICSGGSAESWHKMFPEPKHPGDIPPSPPLSLAWCEEEVVQTCNDTVDRLQGVSPTKVGSAVAIRERLLAARHERYSPSNAASLAEGEHKADAYTQLTYEAHEQSSLNAHRWCSFLQPRARAGEEMEDAITKYNARILV